MSINWSAFAEIISAHQRFLLVSHIRPDADALGSELGMCAVLEALGKDVRIVNGQSTPPNLKFLDPKGKIKAINVDVQPADLDDVEVLIVLDTSAWAQLGAMGDVIRATKARKLIVDHHVSQDDLGAELFKDTKAEATGRLVTDFARFMKVTLNSEIATPLFAAVATDTGWFRFASTSGGTYRCGGELLDGGAVPADIYRQLYEQDSLARVHLIGRVLCRATTELDGRLIYTHVTRADFAELGALPNDTEDIINMTLQVGGTQVAAIFVELLAGGVKVSLRSRSAVNCSQLAEKFGGGGHKAAAGLTLHEPLESVQAKILDAVRSAMV
jgi:phosphoesterase RecJ-like protein